MIYFHLFSFLFQFSVMNAVMGYLGMQGVSSMRVFRTFRCLRPLRAMSRLQGLKVCSTIKLLTSSACLNNGILVLQRDQGSLHSCYPLI